MLMYNNTHDRKFRLPEGVHTSSVRSTLTHSPLFLIRCLLIPLLSNRIHCLTFVIVSRSESLSVDMWFVEFI